jgi:hypothetical protein
MKFAVGAALLAAVALAGCAESQGNPNRQPYANDPGGAAMAKPQTLGTVAYDPYGAHAPFADMQAGQAAINPPPPMPLPAPSANPPLGRPPR